MKPADELFMHDLRAPLAKIKTAMSLMRGASVEELEADYFPIVDSALQELEQRIEELAKRFA